MNPNDTSDPNDTPDPNGAPDPNGLPKPNGAPEPDDYKKVIEGVLQKMVGVSVVRPPSPTEANIIGMRLKADQVVQCVIALEGMPPEGVMPLLEWKTRVQNRIAKTHVSLPMDGRFDLAYAITSLEKVTNDLVAEIQTQRAQSHVDLERAKALSLERDAEAKRLLEALVRQPYTRPLGALQGFSSGLHDISHISCPGWAKLLYVAAQTGVGAIMGDPLGNSVAPLPPPPRTKLADEITDVVRDELTSLRQIEMQK